MNTVHPVQFEPGQSRYGALASAMRARIITGEWPPGNPIPAEQSLAKEHGVALGTMRRALDLLAEQGLVERIHGRGTFVRLGLSGAPMLRFFRFASPGAEAPTSRILARQVRVASVEAARMLGCSPGESALRLKRLRSVGNKPALHEEIWLPLPLFAPLLDGDPADWGDLLYPAFAERCGVHVHRAVDAISFASLGAAHARALHLATGHPCARVQRQAFDRVGRCVEWRTTLGDAHAFHYTVSIA